MTRFGKATAATIFLGAAFWAETAVDHAMSTDKNEIAACYANGNIANAHECAQDVKGGGDVLPGFAEIITLVGATACGVTAIRALRNEE